MVNYKIYPRGHEYDAHCRKLEEAQAWNYRNASTQCGFEEWECGVCPVNLALTENHNHTLASLRKRVAEIIAEKKKNS